MNTDTKTEWRLVPVEPTDEMMQAIDESSPGLYWKRCPWKAALNAAPSPQASEPVGYWFNYETKFVDPEFAERNFDLSEKAEMLIPLYTEPQHAKPCERCAALEAERDDWVACHAKIFRELQETKTLLGNKCAELAALEAENAQQSDARKQAQADLERYKRRCTDIEHQNERLNAENARLTQLNSTVVYGIEKLGTTLDEARATIAHQAEQLAAAQKDVRRLDDLGALIVAGDISIEEREPKNSEFRIRTDTTEYDNPFTGATLREVIDAATAAQKEGK